MSELFQVDTWSLGTRIPAHPKSVIFKDDGSHASVDEILKLVTELDPEMREPWLDNREIRATFESVDTVNLNEVFFRRASAMKTIPHFKWSPFRIVFEFPWRVQVDQT